MIIRASEIAKLATEIEDLYSQEIRSGISFCPAVYFEIKNALEKWGIKIAEEG